ncbi:hypothetical protein SDC9_18901 [bioreactor metagenome]|uniref:NAD-specific glutamate dehydrogenase n=1 Tax=bioreactor metagenome TaxID=1076179 RepID=A0A644U1H7_9ZZZZ
MQHAAVLQVLDLDLGIDPGLELDRLHRAVLEGDGAGHQRQRLDVAFEALDRHHLVAGQAERLAGVAAGELERDDAHADQVRTVDPLEAFRDDRLDAEQVGALRRPVTRRARAVFDAAEDDERDARRLIFHRGVEDRRLFAVRALGVAALDAIQHLVLDADVGEGAAHHDFVVAAARAVAVEVLRCDATLGQVLAGRGGRLERARGRDVVGGDHVAEHREDAGRLHVRDHARFLGHAAEIGRVLDVGRLRRPVVGFPLGGLHALPVGVALEHVGVFRKEGLAGHASLDELGDLGVGRPDVLEIDRLAVLRGGDRLARQVDVHVAGDRIGDHERRRGEEVRAHVGRDPAFEVAVAREHGRSDEVVVVDRLRDRRIAERARVADAGGAAEADDVEAERVKIVLQVRGLQVFLHDLRPGGERGLHPGLRLEAKRARLAGDETGADQHVGVRGVGAGGDRGDHHRAVTDLVILALDGDRLADVDRLRRGVAFRGHRRGLGRDVDATIGGDDLGEGRLRVSQRQVVLRPLRTRDRRDDRAHVELEGRGVDGLVIRAAPEAVFLRIGLDQGDALFRAAGLLEVAQGFRVDREEAAGRAVFGRHVGDGGALRQRQLVEARAVEFDELADHAVFAQHLHDLQHEVGAGGAFDHRAGQLEADDFRDQHRHGLAEHRGLGFDPAHAPAENRRAVHHRGVAVGADEGVRIGHELAVLVGVGPDGLREVFKVHLVADAGAGRHDAEVLERALAPFQELIALHVALVFKFDVALEGARVAEFVDHHRVVDDQVDGDERVDLLRVAAQTLDAVAHRGEVDHGRNAGEVLHQHAGRTIGDFARVLAAHLRPVTEGLDVLDRDREAAVLEPQQVLEHDLQRSGQLREVTEPRLLRGRDRVIGIGRSADGERAARLGSVFAGDDGHGDWPPLQ